MSCNNCCSCSCNHSSLVDISNVQELIPYHQYAVGEFFKIDNEIFKVTQWHINWYSCESCDLYKTDDCFDFNCMGSERTDRTAVQAILYDTEE